MLMAVLIIITVENHIQQIIKAIEQSYQWYNLSFIFYFSFVGVCHQNQLNLCDATLAIYDD